MSIIKHDDKIRIGIVGTNFITEKLIEAMRFEPRVEIAAIYSRTLERAQEFGRQHNIPNIFISLEEMASSKLIDAVYIASPNSCHAEQSILFMNNKKHVLCEKPFASDAREAESMIEAARKNNVTLMEAMKPTLTPGFLKIREYMSSIGTVRRYFSCYCQYSSRYDKLKEGVVLNAFKPELSNGSVMDLGVYTIYPMVVLFGRPTKVSATGLKLSTGVDGQGAVNFEYDGMNATVLYSKIADSHLPTEIQGEQGTVIADRINIINNVKLRMRNGQEEAAENTNLLHEYYYEVAEFINLIKTGEIESKINSHDNSLAAMEIVDEIRRQLGVIYPTDRF